MARFSVTDILSLVLLVGLCFGFAFLLAYDLFWYFGIIEAKTLFLSFAFLGTILSITSILIFLYLKITNRFPKTGRHILTLSCIIILGYSFVLTCLPVRDLNHIYAVERNTAQDFVLYDTENNLVIDIGGTGNVSTEQVVRIYVRFNGTIVSNVTEVSLWYFNGTADNRSATPQFYSNGYPNRYRWTDQIEKSIEEFDNNTENGFFYSPFAIPSQKANTTVVYFILFRIENVTGTFYSRYNGFNYTVQFSETQNGYTTEYLHTVHLFIAIAIILGGTDILLYKILSSTETKSDHTSLRIELARRGLLDKPEGDEYPLTRDLIDGLDRLTHKRNDIRNAAGFVLAATVAFFLHLQDNSLFNFQSLFFILGLYSAVIFSLASILLSLSSPRTSDLNNSIDDGLLPPTSSIEDFRFLICIRAKEQESIIRHARGSLQIAVAAIAIGLLVDIFTSYFPRSAMLFVEPPLRFLFSLSTLLAIILAGEVVKYYLEKIGYELMID